jgi:hypothetical protein
VIQGVEMITPIGGLCCIDFINPNVVVAGDRQALSFWPI